MKILKYFIPILLGSGETDFGFSRPRGKNRKTGVFGEEDIS